MPLLALLALVLSPAAALEFDRGDPVRAAGIDLRGPRLEQARRPNVIRVFVVPKLDTHGFGDAVMSFLETLAIKKDAGAALGFLSTQIDDMGLIPNEALKDTGEYWTFSHNYDDKPSPLARGKVLEYWRSHFDMLIDDLQVRGPEAPKTAAAAFSELPLDSKYAELVSSSFQERKVSYLPASVGGGRLIAFRYRGAVDLDWFAKHRNSPLPEGYEKLLPELVKTRGLDMRVVLAVRRLPDKNYALELTMLWAREGNAWKLWGLIPDENPTGIEKPGR